MKSLKIWILKNWFLTILVTLLITAALLRFYKLGSIPHGMTWDEAAIGYNGFSVLTTRRDEWLHFLPISFQSFGDYKAPAAIYINGFFTYLFGLNLLAVRLPFALASILAIASISLVSWAVARLHKHKTPLVFSLVATALLTFSPWHIHFSRAGFESGMSLAFGLAGVGLLLLYILQNKITILFPKFLRFLNSSYLLLIASSGFLVASMYTYHSAKIVIPLLSLLVVLLFFKFWLKHIYQLLLIAIVSLLLLLPMGWDSINGPGATRLSQTSIFSSQGSLLEKAALFGSNFNAHFSTSFLVMGDTANLRHGAGEWGVLLPTTFAFFVISLGLLLLRKNTSNTKTYLFFVGWLIIGILPAALGADEVPHSNRALLALPGFIGLATLGLLEFIEVITNSKLNQTLSGNHQESNTVRDAVIGTILLLHGIFFLSFWRYYTTVFANNASSDYQDGYLEAFSIAEEYEKGLNGKPMVEKIIFSDEYGQPYIYAIFSRKTSPIYYRGGSLIKYEFKNTDIGDFQRTNTLVVGTQRDLDLPINKADHVIYGGNGEVRFHLYYLP